MIVSNTMTAFDEEGLEVHYIVLRIGSQTFSTTFPNLTGAGILAKSQKVETKNIGIETNEWIKGVFSEGDNHQKIKPIPFEINIYSKPKDSKVDFNPLDWEKSVCERCRNGHLYCEKCKSYVWHKIEK
jgi:tryptophanyl-tRNA synthetase